VSAVAAASVTTAGSIIDLSSDTSEDPLDVQQQQQHPQQSYFDSDVSAILDFTPPHTSTPTHSSSEDETDNDNEQGAGRYVSITIRLWQEGDGEGTEENPVELSSDTSVASSDPYVGLQSY